MVSIYVGLRYEREEKRRAKNLQKVYKLVKSQISKPKFSLLVDFVCVGSLRIWDSVREISDASSNFDRVRLRFLSSERYKSIHFLSPMGPHTLKL